MRDYMSNRRWFIVLLNITADIRRMKCQYHGKCSRRITGSKSAEDADSVCWIVLPWICTFLHDLWVEYIRLLQQIAVAPAAFLFPLNQTQKSLRLYPSIVCMDGNYKYAFGSLPSCIQGDVFRSLYMYVLVNVHGQLYAMMNESERVTWWFRDFDEGGENQSCCILHSNRICGGVASQFHFYPCDYTCPLFLPLLHLLWNVAVWNRSIKATKECNRNSCRWVAFLTLHAFIDEALVVHNVKWIARICSLCPFSLRVNLCSMTSVLILWCMHWLPIVMECE